MGRKTPVWARVTIRRGAAGEAVRGGVAEELLDAALSSGEDEEPATERRVPEPSISGAAARCLCMGGALGEEGAEPLDDDRPVELERVEGARCIETAEPADDDADAARERGPRSLGRGSSMGTCKTGGAKVGGGGAAVLEGG